MFNIWSQPQSRWLLQQIDYRKIKNAMEVIFTDIKLNYDLVVESDSKW